MSELAPGSTFEGRYRIDRQRPDGVGYAAKSVADGAAVQLIEVHGPALRAVARYQKFSHSRLCPVLETISRAGGSGWVVVKPSAGSALDHVLKAGATLPVEVAVMIGIDLADALVGLHQRGFVHGLIRPAAILVDSGDYSRVMLGLAPPGSDPNPYQLPEPGDGSPSAEGDVWALAGVVHFMLLGEPPPVFGYPARELVPHAGIPSDLIELLAACLAQRPGDRVAAAHTLRDLLACSRANSLRPGIASRQPPSLEVLKPGPLPALSPEVLPPGVAAPPPAPLGPARVQHIAIPPLELAPVQRGRRGLVIGVVVAVLLVAAIAALVLSGALG